MHLMIRFTDADFSLGEGEEDFSIDEPKFLRSSDPAAEKAVAAEPAIVMPDGIHPNVKLPGGSMKDGVDRRE